MAPFVAQELQPEIALKVSNAGKKVKGYKNCS